MTSVYQVRQIEQWAATYGMPDALASPLLCLPAQLLAANYPVADAENDATAPP